MVCRFLQIVCTASLASSWHHHAQCRTSRNQKHLYRVFNLKVDRILIWVTYLLRFTCYITQLTCIYS